MKNVGETEDMNAVCRATNFSSQLFNDFVNGIVPASELKRIKDQRLAAEAPVQPTSGSSGSQATSAVQALVKKRPAAADAAAAPKKRTVSAELASDGGSEGDDAVSEVGGVVL